MGNAILCNHAKKENRGTRYKTGTLESRQGRQIGITGIGFTPAHVIVFPLFSIVFNRNFGPPREYNMHMVYDNTGYRAIEEILDDGYEVRSYIDTATTISYSNGSVLISSGADWKEGTYFYIVWE